MPTKKREPRPKQVELFEPTSPPLAWDKLPLEVQTQAMALLTELLASPAAQRLLSQGGTHE